MSSSSGILSSIGDSARSRRSVVSGMAAAMVGLAGSSCQASETPAEGSRQMPDQGRGETSIALSDDGSLAALASRTEPVNRLEILDLDGARSWIYEHPDPSIALLDPTFSPDGQTIAVVAARPSRIGRYDGASDILLINREGRIQHRIAGRYYRHPSFSPDGKEIAYFRDVTGTASMTPGHVSRLEDREGHAFSLFKSAANGDGEVRLIDGAFGRASSLFYSNDGRSLVFRAGQPSKFVAGDPDNGVWINSAEGRNSISRDARIFAQVNRYSLGSAEDPLFAPTPLPDLPELHGVSLAGLCATGVVVTKWTGEFRGDGAVNVSVVDNDKALTVLAFANRWIEAVASARQGSAILVVDSGELGASDATQALRLKRSHDTPLHAVSRGAPEARFAIQ